MTTNHDATHPLAKMLTPIPSEHRARNDEIRRAVMNRAHRAPILPEPELPATQLDDEGQPVPVYPVGANYGAGVQGSAPFLAADSINARMGRWIRRKAAGLPDEPEGPRAAALMDLRP